MKVQWGLYAKEDVKPRKHLDGKMEVGMRYEDLTDRLMEAKDMTLTGHEAWHLYLKLCQLEELKEQSRKLHKIYHKIKAVTDEMGEINGWVS